MKKFTSEPKFVSVEGFNDLVFKFAELSVRLFEIEAEFETIREKLLEIIEKIEFRAF